MNEAAPSNWSTPRFTDRDVVFLEGREYKIEPEKDSPNDDGTINVKVFCNNNTFFFRTINKKILTGGTDIGQTFDQAYDDLSREKIRAKKALTHFLTYDQIPKNETGENLDDMIANFE